MAKTALFSLLFVASLFSLCLGDIVINSLVGAPDPVSAGGDITYTLNFQNNGTDISNTTFRVEIKVEPTGTSFVRFDIATHTINCSGTPLICSIPMGLTSGQNAVAEFVVSSGTVSVGSTVTTTVNVSAETVTQTSSSNVRAETTTIGASSGDVDLQVTMSQSSSQNISPGSAITAISKLVNLGPSTATSVFCDLTTLSGIPGNATFLSSTRGTCATMQGTGEYKCNIGVVEKDITVTITLLLNVPLTYQHGTYNTSIACVSDQQDTNPVNSKSYISTNIGSGHSDGSAANNLRPFYWFF